MRSLNKEHGTKYKPEQLMEWSTGDIKAQKGEKVYHVKDFGVNVAVKE